MVDKSYHDFNPSKRMLKSDRVFSGEVHRLADERMAKEMREDVRRRDARKVTHDDYPDGREFNVGEYDEETQQFLIKLDGELTWVDASDCEVTLTNAEWDEWSRQNPSHFE